MDVVPTNASTRLLKSKAALQKQAKEFGQRQEDCGNKTPLQAHLDKQKYQEFLMDIAERRAKQRRALQRQSKVDRLRNVKEGEAFVVKKQFVEQRIEQINNYFSSQHDLRNPNQEWKLICKQLEKVKTA